MLGLLDAGSDKEVVRADNERTSSRTNAVATSGQPRRTFPVKNRLHRTRVGIDLDRLPDHVTTQTGNTSRKRRSAFAGSEYNVTSLAEIMRRCEQWLNAVRCATGTSGLSGGHIGTVTTSGCQPAPTDNKLT